MLSENTYIKIISDLSIESKGYSKYLKWYISIIERARNRILTDYTEIHHIVPNCFFINRNRKGAIGFLSESCDHKYNLVPLTPEEHLTAHLLLIKCFSSNFKYRNSLIYAANMMFLNSESRKKLTNKEYGWVKRLRSFCASKDNSGEGNPFYNKTHSIETLNLLREMKRGENNPCFETIWITDGLLNKRIKKNIEIPKNWKPGRTLSKSHIDNSAKGSTFGKPFFCLLSNKKCYDKANLSQIEPSLKQFF